MMNGNYLKQIIEDEQLTWFPMFFGVERAMSVTHHVGIYRRDYLRLVYSAETVIAES